MTIENKDQNYHIDTTVSCTIDNAVMQLLGISLSNRDVIDSSDYDTLEIVLSTINEHVKIDYSNATFKKNNDEIKITSIKNERVELLIKDAKRYKSEIIDELGRGSKSNLKRDLDEEKKSNSVHITNSSLKRWALKKYEISLSNNSVKAKPQAHIEKPWLIKDPNDIPSLQDWYTPARYFARKLVQSDPTLRKKRRLLVVKIAEEFAKVGIVGRGKKPLNPETIKKALVNIKFL